MDARKCLEIAKGWLEQARGANEVDRDYYMARGRSWLEAGQACFELESSLRWQEEDEKQLASEQDVDGPAEGEDG